MSQTNFEEFQELVEQCEPEMSLMARCDIRDVFKETVSRLWLPSIADKGRGCCITPKIGAFSHLLMRCRLCEAH